MNPTDHERRNDIAGIGLAVAAGASFGTVAIFAKFAYDDGADPLPLLAVRFSITSILLALGHVLARRRLGLPRAAALKLVALGAFGYGFEASLFFFALDRAPAGVVTLIFYSYPLITTLIALSIRMERFQPRLIVALTLGSVGVATIFSAETGDLLGPLLSLGAAVAVAVYFLLAQVFTKDVDPGAAATWTAVGAALALSTTSVATGSDFPIAATGSAAALGLASAVAFVAMYAAIARLGSARVAIASMTEPVTTLILAAIFLGEEISLRVAMGALLVISALPVLVSREREKDVRPVASDTV